MTAAWDREPGRGRAMTLPKIAISIRQPWAWAIIHAGKDVENRGWPTQFRGPVCIHAAKGMTRSEYDEARYTIQMSGGVAVAAHQLHRGGIIGVAEIVDCVSTSRSPWFFGPYGFVLKNAQTVDFVPAKGALGFFNWLNGEGGR